MYNPTLGPITVNGQTYTKFYAWLPTKSTVEGWIWFDYYYLRPDRYFEGRVLNREEFLLEIAQGPKDFY